MTWLAFSNVRFALITHCRPSCSVKAVTSSAPTADPSSHCVPLAGVRWVSLNIFYMFL